MGMSNKKVSPTITVKYWTLPEPSGDGEAYVRYFTSYDLARAYEQGMSERWGGSCVSEVSMTIDIDTGKIVRSNKNFDPTND